MNNMVSAMVTLLLGLMSALSAIPAQQPMQGVCFDGQQTHLTRIAPLALAQAAASGAYEHSITLPYRAGQRVMLAGDPSAKRAANLSSAGSVRFEPADEVLGFASGPLPLQDVANRLVEGDNQITLTLADLQDGDDLWLVVFSPCTRYRAEGYPNPYATATPTSTATRVPTVTPMATGTATPVATATAMAPVVTQSAAIIPPSATARHQSQSVDTGKEDMQNAADTKASASGKGRRGMAGLLITLLLLVLTIGGSAALRWCNNGKRWF